MSRNGSGGYNLPTNSWNPAVNGVSATGADWQSIINDIASAMQQSISADGQTPITGNIQMGNNKLTGLSAGSATGNSLRWEQLFSQGVIANLASASTVDIGAQNTTFLNITGTTTINSLGVNYNGPRFLVFAGILTLTHSAALKCPGNANITTDVGATCIAVPNIAGTGWNIFAFQYGASLAATQPGVQMAAYRAAVAGGTANALTGTYAPSIAAFPVAPGTISVLLRATLANTTTTPTFSINGLAAKTIVKGNNLPLEIGDIAGAGHWLDFQYDPTLDKWVLQNPASGANISALFSGSKATSGYQRLPGGLLIQWGVSTFADFAATGTITLTYPIAFPANVFNIVDSLALTSGFNTAAAISDSTISLTNFDVIVAEWSAVTQVGGKYRWLAIGN